jgi:hypothetical protein
LKLFLQQSQEGFVYWVEAESAPRKNVSLHSAPAGLGPYAGLPSDLHSCVTIPPSAAASEDSRWWGTVEPLIRVGQ